MALPPGNGMTQRGVRRSRRRPAARASLTLPTITLAVALGLAACTSSTTAGPTGNGPTGSGPTTSTTGRASTMASSSPTTTAAGAASPTTTTTSAAGGAATTTTTLAPRKVAPTHIVVSMYFVRGTTLGVAARTIALTPNYRFVTLTTLVAGPLPSERAAGLGTAIPAGTTLRGLSIVNGVATANFSPGFLTGADQQSLTLRAAEVVYTITQFPNVHSVIFEIGGQRLGIADGVTFEPSLSRTALRAAVPPILLEQPAVGVSLNSPLPLAGLSNFVGTYYVQVADSTGRVIVNTFGTSTVGSTFDDTVPYTTTAGGAGRVRLFTVAAARGSQTQETDIPVQIGRSS